VLKIQRGKKRKRKDKQEQAAAVDGCSTPLNSQEAKTQPQRGLRHFSLKVLQLLEKKKETTYNEVTMIILY
jgi:hypothetical protein